MAPSGQLTAPAVQALLADAALAGDWALDGARSTIGLRSRSIWGLAPVKGVFGQATGHGTISPAGEVSGTITVAAGSIETKNAKRDRHLRSGDFFEAETFPHITFSVERLEPSGDGVTMTGQLTVPGGGPGRSRSRRRYRSPAPARYGSTPRSTSIGPTSASPGTRWAWPR
jgi:polyisoprenoid-binding protein YceI